MVASEVRAASGQARIQKDRVGILPPYLRPQGSEGLQRAVSIFSTMAIVDEVQYFSVHCRWEEKLFQRAMRWIRKNQIRHYWLKPCIACGDFNRSNISSIYDATNHMRSARNFLKVSREDTFANYKRPTQSHGELDHIFFMPIYGFNPLTYTIGPSDLSDHKPVVATFQNKNV